MNQKAFIGRVLEVDISQKKVGQALILRDGACPLTQLSFALIQAKVSPADQG